MIRLRAALCYRRFLFLLRAPCFDHIGTSKVCGKTDIIIVTTSRLYYISLYKVVDDGLYQFGLESIARIEELSHYIACFQDNRLLYIIFMNVWVEFELFEVCIEDGLGDAGGWDD